MTDTVATRKPSLPRLRFLDISAVDPSLRDTASAPPTGTVTLTLKIPALLHERLQLSARAAKRTVGAYAETLLGAAYVAHHRPSGRPDLDTTVARAVILSRHHNTAEIAAATGLSEASVTQVIGAWRQAVREGLEAPRNDLPSLAPEEGR